jgi:hypothetical protein
MIVWHGMPACAGMTAAQILFYSTCIDPLASFRASQAGGAPRNPDCKSGMPVLIVYVLTDKTSSMAAGFIGPVLIPLRAR